MQVDAGRVSGAAHGTKRLARINPITSVHRGSSGKVRIPRLNRLPAEAGIEVDDIAVAAEPSGINHSAAARRRDPVSGSFLEPKGQYQSPGACRSENPVPRYGLRSPASS